MTDHFKDCRNGDIVTVTIKGVFRWHGNMPIVGDHSFIPNDPKIIDVVVRPKPLVKGDRFTTREPREEGSIAGSYLQGEILFIAGDQAYVKYDHTNEYGNEYLSEIERE